MGSQREVILNDSINILCQTGFLYLVVKKEPFSPKRTVPSNILNLKLLINNDVPTGTAPFQKELHFDCVVLRKHLKRDHKKSRLPGGFFKYRAVRLI